MDQSTSHKPYLPLTDVSVHTDTDTHKYTKRTSRPGPDYKVLISKASFSWPMLHLLLCTMEGQNIWQSPAS